MRFVLLMSLHASKDFFIFREGDKMKILIESVLRENENEVLHQKSSIYSNCDEDCEDDYEDCGDDCGSDSCYFDDPCPGDQDIDIDCGPDEDICDPDEPGCYDND